MPFRFNPITKKLDLVDVTTMPPGSVATLTGNSGGAVSPTANNINTVGSGSITVVGNPGTSTLTAQLTGLTNHSLLVGAGTDTITNLGVATDGQLPIGSTGADPVLATLTAGTGISIMNGAGSISISADADVATLYTGNVGTATPALNNLNVIGSGSVTTSASLNTVNIALTGLTNHAVLVGAGTNTITKLAVGTNGQVLIGATGADPAFANITAGTGIDITEGANSLTISSSGGGLTWSVVTVNATFTVNTGTIANKAGTLAMALPATSAVGDVIAITGINTALGWQITQAANQQIFFGSSSTTLGATGTLTSSATRDTVTLVCVVADLVWNVISSIGNPTVA